MTVVQVRYFGKLRELVGVKNEEYTVKEGTTVADLLLSRIPEKHSEVSKTWAETLFRTIKSEIIRNKDGTPVLDNYLIMINGKSAKLNGKLRQGDEVAIMPPFGGG